MQAIENIELAQTCAVDVAIVGAGIVGLAAGVALKRAGYSVKIIDAQPQSEPKTLPIDPAADWDNRIYALSPSNITWLTEIGVWQYVVQARVAEMRHMSLKFSEYQPSIGLATSSSPLILSAEDANQAHLGCIIEAKNLKQALLAQLASLDAPVLFSAQCENIKLSAQNHQPVATLCVTDVAKKATKDWVVSAKLLIGADGAQSWVRSALNIGLQKKSYAQTAIVANFIVEKPHDNVAYQWFYTKAAEDANAAADEHADDFRLTKNAILAWLPLPSLNNQHRVSIVWSLSNEDADKLIQLPEDAFTAAVQAAGEQTLGAMQLDGKRAQYALHLLKTEAMTQANAILMGDAAHTIHPMAGQGMNLGLRDVKDLMALLAAKSNVQAMSDAQLLKAYTRRRKLDVLNMQLLTDGLFELMAQENAPLKKVRQWGFNATKLTAVKRLLVSNAIQY